jgi:pimeloyl-ACP methyl ester carboxylesterase
MDRLSLDRTSLLGHSHGGRVSIALAAEHPDHVDHLILVNSAGIRPPRTHGLRLRGLVARGGRKVLAHPLAGSAGRRALSHLYASLGMTDYANAGPLRATFVRIVNEDLVDLLPRIQAQTLIIWGARDTETPLWMGDRMARTIPKARMVVLEEAGHYSFLDEPGRFEHHVLGFLAGDSP